MNDVADRDFDPHVERTQNRPLASGELTVEQALVAFFCADVSGIRTGPDDQCADH